MTDERMQDRDEAPEIEPAHLDEWETPELIVEEVQSATFGGTLGTVQTRGDDVWYES